MSRSEHKEHCDKILKSLTVWLDPEFHRQLKILAAEQKTHVRILVVEFLNDGLEKYGKARVTVRRVDAP
jgi:predicted HicB family RNase H-like nuclease